MFERQYLIFNWTGAELSFGSTSVAEYRRRRPELKSDRLPARVSIGFWSPN
jgi:hypothetical protein